MEAENKIYISIDSNDLRAFSFFDKLVKIYKGKYPEYITPELESSESFSYEWLIRTLNPHDPIIKNHPQNFSYLYKLLKQDKVRFYITETVLRENKHIKDCITFMIENCYMHTPMSEKEKDSRQEEISNLVNAYTTQQLINKRGQKIIVEPPMKKEYSAFVGKMIPTNDCFIMAEATVDNVTLLTDNGKDFIFDIKENKFNEYGKLTKSRTARIVDINIALGYYSINEFGNRDVPKPLNLDTLANIIKYKGLEAIETPSPNEENIINASSILSY